jgi:hypothetical protein
MEPLTILGGVAASAQLTKYSLSLFRSAAKLPGQLRSAPEAIKSLMEDVEGYLATLRSFSLESQNSEDSLALQAKIDRCTYSATQLQGMLKQMVFQDNDTRSIRLKKAIAFRRKTRTIGKRLADIERGRGILSFHIFK